MIDFSAVAARHPLTGAQVGSPALRAAFVQPRQVLVAHHLHEVRPLVCAVDAAARAGAWAVGGLCYEAAPAWDAALQVHVPEADAGPLACFGLFEAPSPWPQAHLDALQAQHRLRATWQAGLSWPVFQDRLDRLRAAIAAGELYQANLTTALVGQALAPPLALWAALRQAQPGGFGAWLDWGNEQWLSASPELFFDWHQGHLITRPMKGTAPRGATAADDAAQAQALARSPKERAENVMIVDLLRNDLSRVAQPHSVQVEGLCQVQALPTVWQMTSDVHADTRPGTSLDAVLGALFPCGSVTGAPKVQAMRHIRVLEDGLRGLYCGAIGVVRPGGDATFNVPIRTLHHRQGQLRSHTGSGITFDAQADGEWREWRHKQAFVARASQGFELLETLALVDGDYPAQALHLDRLAASARHFGWADPRAAAAQTLADLARRHPQGRWRVRLCAASDGRVVGQAFALDDSPTPVRLVLASGPMALAHSEWVRHKTTRRAHYDAWAPTDPQVFDTVLWNEARELTECTRGNLALQIGGRWLTPALACGLLPGVGRAQALAQGRVQEAVITLDDLPQVQGLAFLNSLRGWLPAVWHADPMDVPTGPGPASRLSVPG